jgi:hypothetical protein
VVETITIGRGFNECEIRAAAFDAEARTVEIVWAAGAAVKRRSWSDGEFLEELSMDPAHIRLGRFASGMSLLDSHDAYSMDSRIGTVLAGSVRIEGGKGYATVKLSRKKRGEELFQDLRDGHPFPVSVGYRTHAYEKHEGDGNKLPTLRAVDWEPMELSAVPVPADAGASSRNEESMSKAIINNAPTLAPDASDLTALERRRRRYLGDRREGPYGRRDSPEGDQRRHHG